MRKIKLYSVVSIDGFNSSADGSVDWIAEANIPRNVDFGIHKFFQGVGTVIMTLTHYLDLTSCELLGPHMDPEKQCVIVRHRDDIGISGNFKVDYITDPYGGFPEVVKYLRQLKNKSGEDIWIAGDHKLIRAMFDSGIIDDVIITMLPVSLGKGVKLFPSDFNESKWRSTRLYRNEYGVTQIHYRSVESAKTHTTN